VRLRPALSVVLLAFVLLAVATMIVKGTRRSQGARALSAELQQPSAAAAHVGEPTTTPEKTPVAGPATGTGAAATVPAPPAPIATPYTPVRSGEPALPPAAPRRVVRVTYFHTTYRCLSCYKIEALSEAAVSGTFAAALAKGDLVWRTINIDEPWNEHYVNDYQLFTKSVIVSEVIGGKEVRFKNLDRVWKLLGDERAFARYVVDEVSAFVGHS